MAGLSVDMERLAALCAPQGIKIVEDAAHALPASTRGELVGSCRWSDATVFSFYANKTITTGEGGMVTTRNSEIAERIRVMRQQVREQNVYRWAGRMLIDAARIRQRRRILELGDHPA